MSTYTTAEQKAADRRALEAQLKAARETRDAADAELQRLEKAASDAEAKSKAQALTAALSAWAMEYDHSPITSQVQRRLRALLSDMGVTADDVVAALAERVRPPAPDAGPEMETVEAVNARWRRGEATVRMILEQRDAAWLSWHAADKAKAVEAEREACATVAELCSFDSVGNWYRIGRKDAARAIRARKDGE